MNHELTRTDMKSTWHEKKETQKYDTYKIDEISVQKMNAKRKVKEIKEQPRQPNTIH
jgi:hypothetical protein